jgi:hypothetical protein
MFHYHCSMKWLLVVSLTLALAVRGQFLPGMDEKPELESPTDTMEDCATATNGLLSLEVIRKELLQINSQYVNDDIENSCQQEGSTYICDVDFSLFENDLQSICESNDGQYDEREHQVGCEGTGGIVFVYKVSNYPTCYAKNCEAPDVERFISREVEDLEQNMAQEFEMDCNSEYEIEDDDGEAYDSNNQCPNRANAAPNTCGPLESKASGQLCDCYTFCNGELIACETFDNPTGSIACEGDLVAGCDYALFGIYDVEKSSTNHVSVVASFMLLVFALLF